MRVCLQKLELERGSWLIDESVTSKAVIYFATKASSVATAAATAAAAAAAASPASPQLL